MMTDDDCSSSGEYSDDSEQESEEIRPAKRARQRNPHISAQDLWKSPWGVMMRSDEINNPLSKASTKFRLRFRLPFKVFKEYFVPKCIELNVFEMKRRGSIPIEFKLLVVLRILARGNDFDTLNELSMIPLSTCHKIFCDFVFNFVPKFLPLHVSMPTGSELRDVMNTYKAMGFNGAIGSIDCTHVLLNKCPKEYANICTGKEKKPTLAFQVVVSHDRQVLMVSDAFFGSYNDKMIVKNVKETLKMINGK